MCVCLVLLEFDRLMRHAVGAHHPLHATSPSLYGAASLTVSKTKPAAAITALYEGCGTRIFGENYVQELVGKAAEVCEQAEMDVCWFVIQCRTVEGGSVGSATIRGPQCVCV